MIRIFLTLLFSLMFFISALSQIDQQLKNTDKSVKDQTTSISEYKKSYKEQSILFSGSWIKIATTESGIQKISYSKLIEMGVTNPSNVAIYSNGGYMLPKKNSVDYPDDLSKIFVYHQKDKNGIECIFFYSPGNNEWIFDPTKNMFIHSMNPFSDSTYFYIASDVEKSPSPSDKEIIQNIPEITFSEYDELQFLEEEKSNLIASGRRWFGEKIISMTKKTFSFDFPYAVSGHKAKVLLSLAARSFDKSSYYVKINNIPVDTVVFPSVSRDEEAKYAYDYDQLFEIDSKENVRIELYFDTKNLWGESWLDFISLNMKSKLIFSKNQLSFRNSEAKNYNNVEYSVSTQIKNPVIWNITEPLIPKSIKYNVTESGSLSFIDNGEGINSYIIFDPVNGEFPDESKLTAKVVKNQNIHGLPSCDMIIVSHPDFIIPSEELAEFHRSNDNLNVLLVTTEEVYNEFSSGIADVSSIRNMMRMFFNRSSVLPNPLKYLLLMGDGSFDNRYFDRSKSNFIPTYQSVNSLEPNSSYVTDDFFGLFDDGKGEITDFLYIGIGRIPCKTKEEAETTVNKIINYSSSQSLGNWRNVLCFIADDEDNNDYMRFSEDLVNIVSSKNAGFYADKIYFDSYKQFSTSGGDRYPDVTTAINRRVGEGALILNYIGHANPNSLAHESVLGINDIKSWNNSTALPIFVTATCQFGRFDQSDVSAGEQILLNPTGGGVGLFTTTRVVYASDNQELSVNFFNNIFNFDDSGEKLRLGDVFKNAKNESYTGINKLKFALLADPALRLAFPKFTVRTKAINNVDVNQNSVSVGALEKVTINGEILDHSGSKIKDFNGEVTTTIYDKEIIAETLGNDGGSTFKYSTQNNIIYKGISTVANGEFELSFIVPKDISYNVGQGKILYYASNGETDGNGSTTDIRIGGTVSNPVVDNNPPEINLFLNNEDFKSYDNVSSNALLLVNLFDESGINTVGTGIGHDIVAVIDSDYSNQFILNDYYSSETNSYQRGKILFPLSDLSLGVHKIWVKVWDIQNNSSEKELYFNVEDGFKITEIKNIPNPITYYTDFEISHNLPGDTFDATIQIYNLRGQKIDEINETFSSYGNTSVKIRWDIFQTDNPIYSDQILIYKAILVNSENIRASKTGKIIINLKN